MSLSEDLRKSIDLTECPDWIDTFERDPDGESEGEEPLVGKVTSISLCTVGEDGAPARRRTLLRTAVMEEDVDSGVVFCECERDAEEEDDPEERLMSGGAGDDLRPAQRGEMDQIPYDGPLLACYVFDVRLLRCTLLLHCASPVVGRTGGSLDIPPQALCTAADSSRSCFAGIFASWIN